MNAKLRRKLSTAVRTLDFTKAHPWTDSSYQAVVAKLQDRIARADALVVQQGSGIVDEHAAIGHRNATRDRLRQRMRHLVRVADLTAETDPELPAKFIMPASNAPNRTLIAAAKVMVDAATPQKDLLISLGLGENFLDGLPQLIAEFDASTGTAHGGRSDHVGAAADLKGVIRECGKLIGVLDGLMREHFHGDLEALAAWESASNEPGPFRSHQPSPEPTPEPVPAVAPLSAGDPAVTAPKIGGS